MSPLFYATASLLAHTPRILFYSCFQFFFFLSLHKTPGRKVLYCKNKKNLLTFYVSPLALHDIENNKKKSLNFIYTRKINTFASVTEKLFFFSLCASRDFGIKLFEFIERSLE